MLFGSQQGENVVGLDWQGGPCHYGDDDDGDDDDDDDGDDGDDDHDGDDDDI